MRGIQSHATVQQMVMTFVDNAVDLVIAHDELTTFQLSEQATNKMKVDCRRRGASVVGGANESFRGGAKLQSAAAARKRLSFGGGGGGGAHIDDSIDSIETASTRLPTIRPLSMTPLYNSSEYTPVYANRVTIINTTEDEKWQQLSRKRSDQLSSRDGYVSSGATNDSSRNQRNRTNDAVYALCRPHSCHQIVDGSSAPITTTTTTITDVNPTRINKAHESFGLQKSQTDSCLAAASVSVVPVVAPVIHTQKLFVPSQMKAATCDTTISIQIGGGSGDGACYVQGLIQGCDLTCLKINRNSVFLYRLAKV